jgi:alcohol dehydrogenase class IV
MPREFLTPRRMITGENAVESFPNEIKGLKKNNPLVVTDAGIVEAGVLRRLLFQLDGAKISYKVFSEVEPDPEIAIIERGRKTCQDGSHYHVAHGIACGLFLTGVLRENMDAAPEESGEFLEALGYEAKNLSGKECAEKLIMVMSS